MQIREWADISDGYHQGAILLGNGASIAVSPSFCYESLLHNALRQGTLAADVQQLFKYFGTCDFELILRMVWQAHNVNKSLGVSDERTYHAYRNVRECLIRTVRGVHPTYEMACDFLPKIYQFLEKFGTVISLNYDLLVYWAMTCYGFQPSPHGHLFKDCFINGVFDDDWQRFRSCYREQTNTLVFYPHGNLALCRNIVGQEFKIHSGGESLLEAILADWHNEQYIPLFVSEGTMRQKISSIQNSYYLSTVYREILTSPQRSLTIFGWGLGEHDGHLLQQMRWVNIKRVAVSVFGGNLSYCHHASQLIIKTLGPVSVDFFDSKSPGCWIN